MKKILILTMTLALGGFLDGHSFALTTLTATDTIYSFTDVDKEPEPEKGMKALYRKWSSGAAYPSEARRKGIEGRVFIYFVVNESGEITETGIRKGIGSGCDEAALEAFRKVDFKWKPGSIKGKNVKVKMLLPFTFKLG